jgi:hypothetical protein
MKKICLNHNENIPHLSQYHAAKVIPTGGHIIFNVDIKKKKRCN